MGGGGALYLGEGLFWLEAACDRLDDRFLLLHRQLRHTGCGRDRNVAAAKASASCGTPCLLTRSAAFHALVGNVEECGCLLGGFAIFAVFFPSRRILRDGSPVRTSCTPVGSRNRTTLATWSTGPGRSSSWDNVNLRARN